MGLGGSVAIAPGITVVKRRMAALYFHRTSTVLFQAIDHKNKPPAYD